jgi:hypothetical protein
MAAGRQELQERIQDGMQGQLHPSRDQKGYGIDKSNV